MTNCPGPSPSIASPTTTPAGRWYATPGSGLARSHSRSALTDSAVSRHSTGSPGWKPWLIGEGCAHLRRRQFSIDEGLVGLDDPPHQPFELGKVVLVQGSRQAEVVVEAILGGWSDARLDQLSGEVLSYRLDHDAHSAVVHVRHLTGAISDAAESAQAQGSGPQGQRSTELLISPDEINFSVDDKAAMAYGAACAIRAVGWYRRRGEQAVPGCDDVRQLGQP